MGFSLAAAVTGFSGCREPALRPTGAPRASGKFPQDAYVWQRLWTREVATAVRQARGRVAQLTVLAAEVDLAGYKPRLIRPQLDFAAIAGFSGPCSLAFRIGPFSGPFGEGDARTGQIAEWISETLASVRSGGWEPEELQIDFDAATSKLAGYRDWLAVFGKVVAPLPISFTALPDWLNSPILREMAELAGRYVLQVHAVERARAQDTAASLVDVQQARRWVEHAGEMGVPFHVALPTYRSVAGFNPEGKIIGIDSEGPGRSWPEGTRVVTYSSPAPELAQLIRDWAADRPAALSGVIWYRLPVTGESRNWTWATLAPVMSGVAPAERLEIARAGVNPLDLCLLNAGEAEMAWPEVIRCRASPASGGILAGDALGGYQLEFDPSAPNEVVFRKNFRNADCFLPPGGKKPLGWLRFHNATTVSPHELSITIQ